MRVRGNILHPLGLTHLDHVTRYNYLNECMVVVTSYYDEELLAQLGMLDDIRWLFARGGMRLFRNQRAYISGLDPRIPKYTPCWGHKKASMSSRIHIVLFVGTII